MSMTKSLSPLATRIKELADEKGMSIAEIGRRAGKSDRLVQNLMDGLSMSLNSDSLVAVARVLETTPEYLLGIEESETCGASTDAAAAAKAMVNNAEVILEFALQALRSNDLQLQRTMIGAMKAVLKNHSPTPTRTVAKSEPENRRGR